MPAATLSVVMRSSLRSAATIACRREAASSTSTVISSKIFEQCTVRASLGTGSMHKARRAIRRQDGGLPWDRGVDTACDVSPVWLSAGMAHRIMFDEADLFLHRVREIASSFPDAAEKVSHGRPVFYTTTIFAYYGGSVDRKSTRL